MKLKILNIHFRKLDDLFSEINSAINSKSPLIDKENEIYFDSLSTFQKFMSQNKLQILMAISRLKPESVYQLEKMVGRQYPHVLKDCRMLESFGFIRLIESSSAKKQLRPELVFNYDIIKVNSSIEEILLVSKESNQVLLNSIAG